jgi:hypothetical protein
MENKSFSDTFGSSTQDPYVQSLATKGAPSSTSTPSSMTRRIATAMSSTWTRTCRTTSRRSRRRRTSCSSRPTNGDKGGLFSINAFLAKWIPIIQASPAYQQDGLIVINFDESADVLPAGTATVNGKTVVTLNLPGDSCCGQQSGPNVTRPMDSILAASATMNYDLHY